MSQLPKTPEALKPLPSSQPFERACLAACLLAPEVFSRLRLCAEDFHREAHREIWLSLDMLHEEGEPIDLHTLQDVLKKRGAYDKAGGLAYLAGLDLDLPDLSHVETYAKRLREYRRRRARIQSGERYVQALYAGNDEEIPEREQEVLKILQEKDYDDDQTPVAVDVDTFLSLSFPPRIWLVEGLIQEKDAGMIHAWRGIGKTHFVLSLTWALVSGGQFLRFNIPEPAGVLVIDGEMPREDLQRRLGRIVHASTDQRRAPLRLLAADMFESGLPSLATPAGQAVVDANLSAFPEIKAVVVDNISTLCMAGQAENEAESWNGVQEFILRLRRRGIAVIFVHHSNKNLSQRGTSKREDILSWVLDLRRPDDYREEEGARFEMRFSKARAIHGEAAQPLDVQMIDTAGDGIDWTWKSVEDKAEQRTKQREERQAEALDLLDTGVSAKDAAEAVGVHPVTVYRWMKDRTQDHKEDSTS